MITSIIILTKNQLDYTKQCIESIRTYTKQGTYELIVVDNFSTDNTRTWLHNQPDIKVILNDQNLGFPKGCNQGIEVATGDNILLLNNDTVVTENWLDNLCTCLYSAEDIGAVGPVTNFAGYDSTIRVEYENNDEMQLFAKEFNQSNAGKWEQRVKLVGFCMLIKKSIVDKIGLLDERFTPGNFEDDDYSYRIQLEGYRLMICKDTFIHHYGRVTFKSNNQINYSNLLRLNLKKFERKWGFNSLYSASIRTDVLMLIKNDRDQEINVLEVGCATGATLLEIKNRYKNANVFGIEINPNSAAISQKFIDVKAENIEGDISFPKDYFDYILFGDVLEHLYDPWKVLNNIRKYLKPNGKVLISIPNVMHYSVIDEVLNGGWTYQDAGLLDRTHIRFFTLKELDKMLSDNYYADIQFRSIRIGPENEHEVEFVNDLTAITDSTLTEQYNTYQYLIEATKVPDTEVTLFENVKMLADAIEFGVLEENNLEQLIQLQLENPNYQMEILEKIIDNSIDAVKLFQKLGVKSFEQNRDSSTVLTYLYAAYELEPLNDDTIYNLAYILSEYGNTSEAIKYLETIEQKDEDLLDLYHHLLSKNL